MLTRRSFLAVAAALSLAPLVSADSTTNLSAKNPPDEGIKFGPPRPFTFESLIARAKDLQNTPYKPQTVSGSNLEVLDALDYDALNEIIFKNKKAIFAQGPGLFPLTFFHMGRLFKTPMRIFIIDPFHQAREALYSPSLFSMPANSPAHHINAKDETLSFAGFRFQENRLGSPTRREDNWVAFLGSSYFRAVGDEHQYGLSARGLAINSGQAIPEEFPLFTEAYIETPQFPNQDFVEIALLLEGPSVVGAYRFKIWRNEAVSMDVESHLFFRQDVEHLGIAPLTSMYWFSEIMKPTGINWRPEVHDSDGLAIWTGEGEHIWRPLNNPPRIITSTFLDHNVKGFGLMQRDRSYDHYLDNVHYERRPSLWVTPRNAWGEGSVALTELPTQEEVYDNIVAYWIPKTPIKKGDSHRFDYSLTWAAQPPESIGNMAKCISTYLEFWETHWGNQPFRPRPDGGCAFYVQFAGGPLASLPLDVRPQIIVSTSRGTIEKTWIQVSEQDHAPPTWFGCFSLTGVPGKDPVELRLFLKHNEKTLTETWMYQYWPHTY
jgi:glucans biosynthesis protein